jgi:hypothetical protein
LDADHPEKGSLFHAETRPNGIGQFGPHTSTSFTLESGAPVMETKTGRIRALNDAMRQNLVGGMAIMTPGIAALGQEAVARIIKTIEVYDDFCHANDPHEEHDFGAFDADGKRVFFKIDYYDESLTVHSPDPSDPNVTKRVITIMLAEEY